MVNNKMSLGEKVARGIAIVSLGGIFGAMAHSTVTARTYPTINKEVAIVYEVKRLENNELLIENPSSLEHYSAFREEYTRTLENKLQEVRASPQYAEDTQKKGEDNKTQERNAYLILISAIALAVSTVYGIKKGKEREKSSPSGAPQ
mgnify:FL=1